MFYVIKNNQKHKDLKILGKVAHATPLSDGMFCLAKIMLEKHDTPLCVRQ